MAATPVAAQEQRFSVALEAGSTSYREVVPSTGSVASGRSTAALASIGVQMAPLWRLDVGALKLGNRWKTGALIAVTKDWQFSDDWGAFLRFGLYQRRTDRYGQELFGDTERFPNSNEPFVGGGVVWRFAPGFSAALGWSGYELPIFGTDGFLNDGQGANVVSLGLRFAF